MEEIIMQQTENKKSEGRFSSELFGYNTDLRSMTGGIGVFSYEFSRYEQAPGDIQKKEVEARAAKIDTLDV